MRDSLTYPITGITHLSIIYILIYILIEQVQLPRSGPATPGNFREATVLPPVSIFYLYKIYYSLYIAVAVAVVKLQILSMRR